MQLTNKTILITGGTSGIGKVLANTLKDVNTVLVTGTNDEKLNTMASEGFHTFRCDLSQTDQIEELVMAINAKFDRIDILFNNAGIQYNYDFRDAVIPVSKIGHEIHVNVTGQLILTNQLLPLLCASENGMIVNTTSGLSRFPKVDGLVYSVSKAAMRSFTIGLDYFLREYNIKVIEFIPPVTATHMTSGRDEKKMSPEELVKQILPQIEKGRSIVTTRQMRFFIFISKHFPSLAHKILSK